MHFGKLGNRFQKYLSILLAFLLVLFSAGMGPFVSLADAAAATWTAPVPGLSSTTTLAHRVAYGNSQWLMFTSAGDFGVSNDAVSWTKSGSISCQAKYALYTGTRWVVACNTGKIFATNGSVLADGNWFEKSSTVSANLSGIAVNEAGKIVITGEAGGALLSSSNGDTWVNHPVAEVTAFNGVAYGEGKFIAVGKTGTQYFIYSSTDGDSWNKVAATPTKELKGVAYGNGKFVAVGVGGYILASDDGAAWTEKTPPADVASLQFAAVSFGGGKFFAGGVSETIISSEDGSTWETELTGGSKTYFSMAATEGRAVAAGTQLLYKTAAFTVSPPSAKLSNLTVTPSSGLTFSPDTETYTVNVDYGTSSVQVTPTTSDPGVTVNGNATSSGQAVPVTLESDGSTDISIIVTSSGGATKTYTVTVLRNPPSTNAGLSNISLSAGAVLSPSTFNSSTLQYDVAVNESTNSVSLTPMLAESHAALQVDDGSGAVAWTHGTAYNVSLTKGQSKTVKFLVTAQDGSTKQTYQLDLERAKSTNANLTNLLLTDGSLDSAFNANDTEYTVQLPYTKTEIGVTPQLADNTASYQVLEVVSGADQPVADAAHIGLQPNVAKVIKVRVTAQDTSVTKTYQVTVTRAAPSTDNKLNSLKVDNVLVPGFTPATTGYTMNVPYTKAAIDVTFELSDDDTATHQVKIDDLAAADSELQSLDLDPGDEKKIEIVVTAQSGAVETYTLLVTRQEPAVDNTLSNLRVNGTLVPGFTSPQGSYAMSVPYTTAQIDVTFALGDPATATYRVEIGDAAATVSDLQDLDLVAGTGKKVEIIVTAQNGDEKTYTLTVTRNLPASDKTLSSFSVDGVPVPGFNSSKLDYTLNVPYTTSQVNVMFALGDPDTATYQLKIDDTPATASDLVNMDLDPGVGKKVEVIVTAQNGDAQTYELVITRAEPSHNALLSGLTLSDGVTIDPTFDSAKTEYDLLLDENTGSMTFAPLLADSVATMTVDDGDGAETWVHGDPFSVTLAKGGTADVEIEVTAQDGTTKQTYQLHLERAKSTITKLADLQLNTGTLTPSFDEEETEYEVHVPFTTTEIGITPVLADSLGSYQVLTVEGGVDQPVADAAHIGLVATVPKVIKVKVTAQNTAVTETYTVTVTRAAPATDNTLSSLSVDGTLVTGFTSAQETYTMTKPYTTGQIDVTFALSDPATATYRVEIGDAAATVSDLQDLELVAGAGKKVEIIVTAQNGDEKTYTLTVTRDLPAIDKSLSSLTVDGAPVPGFNSSKLDYTLGVPYTTSQVNVMFALGDPATATYQLEIDDAAATASDLVNMDLDPGIGKKVEVIVTAQNGDAQTYELVITRAEPSHNALLSGLTLSDGVTIDPTFDSATTEYDLLLDENTGSMTFAPLLADSVATMTVDDGDGAETWVHGDPFSVTLAKGGTADVEIEVTAQDGTTKETYQLHLERAKSTITKLADLQLTTGTLDPSFDEEETEYEVQVPYTTTEIGITPELADSLGSYQVLTVEGGVDQPVADAAHIGLTAGVPKIIKVKVTAQNTAVTETYTVTVTRAAPATDNTLSSLSVDGTLVTGFTSAQETYTMTVPYTTEQIDVTFALGDPATATYQVEIGDAAATVSDLQDLNLVAGTGKKVEIIVTAQNGDEKTYTLTVTRDLPATDKTLSSFTVDGTSVPGFNSSKLDYTLDVPYATSQVNVQFALGDPATASYEVEIDDEAATALDLMNMDLDPGDGKKVEVIVKAQNGDIQTYELVITRAEPSTVADLIGLTVNAGSLTPGFTTAEKNYTLTVNHSVSTLDVTPTLSDLKASVSVNGVPLNSGDAVGVPLSANPTTIKVEVTAEDGSTKNTYTIVVTKLAPPVDDKVKGTLQGNITKLIGNGNKLSADVYSPDGKTLLQADVDIIGANGKFELKKIEPGSYRMVIYVVGDNGTKLAGQTAMLSVNANKEATASASVIDPFGVVTDAISKKAVDGVNVTVYWADTALNKSQGRTPGAKVELPRLSPMTNKNANGQTTGKDGQFGWLLLPEGDYYIVAEKEGYDQYDGRNAVLHVGQTAVQTNITLQPKVLEEGVIEPYITGYPDGTFKPDRGITRAELASILLRVINIKAEASASIYSDVSASNWAAPAIAEVTKRGLMVGYPDGTFQPNQQMSRAEIAIVLGKVKQLSGTPQKSTFTDIDKHWAKHAILLAEQAGLLSGHSDGKFRPDNALTRAEAVVIFNKVLGWNDLNVDKPQRWSDVPKNYWAYKDIMRASVPHMYQKLGNGMVIWK